VFTLEIHNAGNIRDRYELWTETSSAIRIRFALDRVPLTRREIVERVEVAETVPVPSAARGGAARQGGGGLGKKARGLGGIGASIARGLSSIVRYLPASLRDPIQRSLSTYYRGQGQARHISSTASHLSQSASRVSSLSGPASATQQAQDGQSSQITRTAKVTRTVTLAGYQTPLVEPGEQLKIDTVVDPARQHYQSRDYLLKVFSRSIELEGAPLVIAQKSIQIQGIPLLRRILPFLLIYGFAILGLFALQWILAARF
jgi:hypothetical protein